jgi:hypothetical protein
MLCFSSNTSYAFEFRLSKHAAKCVERNDDLHCKLNGTGAINLMKATNANNTKNIFLKINHDIEGELRLYHQYAKHKDAIKGEFMLDNFSGTKTQIQYKVVFKDKKGAVAQTKGQIHLAVGERQKIRFSTIVLPLQDIKNISTYEISMVAH